MSSKRFVTIFLFSVICLLTFFPGFDLGQASLVLDGQIVKNGKELKAGQKVKMTLRIYDDEFGGKLLFEEKQEVATGLKRALFTFEKGKIMVQKRTSALKTESLWVEVESDGQVLSPRLNLAAIGTTADLEGGSLNLRGAGLRTAGEPAMVIGGDGIMLNNRVKAEGNANSGFDTSPDGAIVSGVNSYSGDSKSYGGYFEANYVGVYGEGSSLSGGAVGVVGIASNFGDSANYGGYFGAAGSEGIGVFGIAFNDENFTNYGGYFISEGNSGKGVYGEASGAFGDGVYGSASGATGYGVRGVASGSEGKGVYGKASNDGDVTNYGGYFEAKGGKGIGVYGEASGATGKGVYGSASGAFGDGVYGEASGANAYGVHGLASGDTGVGVSGKASGDNGKGVSGNGKAFNFYASGTGTDYGPFTGAHEVRLADDVPENIKPGLIMSVTGETHVRRDEQGEVSLSSTLATVALARKARDKKVYGVLVSITPLPEDHWYQAAAGDEFGIVNALGEGRVWVSNINGPIEPGDYITTSPVPGYGQLQDDDFLRSYTLGKAIEGVDWDNVTETVEHNGETIKIYLIAVAYTSG